MNRKILSVILSIILVFTVTVTCSFAAGLKGRSSNGGKMPAFGVNVSENEPGNAQEPGDESGDGQEGGGQDGGGQDQGSDQDQGEDREDSSGQQSSSGSNTGDKSSSSSKKEEQPDKSREKGNSEKAKDEIRKVAKNSNLSKEDEDKALDYEDQITQIDREMAAIEAKLKELQEKIDKYEKTAGAMKKKLASKQKDMGKRLRTIYKAGSVGFADVVLSSDNVSDMFANVEMVKRIYSSDRRAIKSLKEEYKKLEKEAKKLEAAKKEQKAILKEQLEKMEQQNDVISASAYLFSASGNYKGGKLLWPCPSGHSISSKFGWRNCPFHGRELHRGIDIPTYTGADILAACDGIVIRSTYSSGYGNYVTISHGGGLVTLYAHNSRLVAKAGQKVKRGQVIAKAGSTGPSTGTHCHFEVQLNGKLVDPMSMLKK